MWSSDDELEVPDLEGKSTTTTHDTVSSSVILWQSAFKISSAADLSNSLFMLLVKHSSIIRLGSAVPLTHEKMHKLLGFDTENWCTEDDCIERMASKNPRSAVM